MKLPALKPFSLKQLSLRLRLILLFLGMSVMTWFVAGAISWYLIYESVDEVFDTQQLLLAKSLVTSNLTDKIEIDTKAVALPETKKLIHHGERGNEDDDAMGFAIFTSRGQLVLHDGENGKDFIYTSRRGFVNSRIYDDDDMWRILWMNTPDERFVIAVGQEIEFRDEIAQKLLLSNLLPWLATLPILLLAFIWMVHRELLSLRKVAVSLRQRDPDDATLLPVDTLPKEVHPLIQALNTLFGRITNMLVRERRFTSDAAHELRTPLAALRVQAEVIQLAGDDPETREHAVMNLLRGIDRSSHLVDQLLILSRLDSLSSLTDITEINWSESVNEVVQMLESRIERKEIQVLFEQKGTPPVLQGQALLISLLLRNLIDNALRYTPEGGKIEVLLNKDKLMVKDNGKGVSLAFLERLGERFFRPPGQQETGSGLGLSIVERIAELHGLGVLFENIPTGGFCVTLLFKKT